MKTILILMTLALLAVNVQAVVIIHPSEKFFTALHLQEAGGVIAPKDGDGGKAIGPFQIHRAYWQDAVEYAGLGGKYEDCRNMDYARTIVTAYLNRYGRKAIIENDMETLARLHNGGPSGHKKTATLKYWNQFKVHLKGKEG